jgi:hypothetical protein
MASPYSNAFLKGTLLLLITPFTHAAPVAYQNVEIDGKNHAIVIVESHPDQSITYTIKQTPTRVALKDAPPALKKLLKPQKKPNPSTGGLSPEEIQAIKKKWDDWATRSKTLSESKKQAPRLPPTKNLEPDTNTPQNNNEDQNPKSNEKIPGPRGTIEEILAEDDSSPLKPIEKSRELTEAEAAPAKVLVVIQSQTPQGAIVERYEHQTPNPSVDLLAYHIATNVPLKTSFLVSGLQGYKGQKKAVLIQNEGPHSLGGIEIQKYKVLEEMTPPPEIFMGPPN